MKSRNVTSKLTLLYSVADRYAWTLLIFRYKTLAQLCVAHLLSMTLHGNIKYKWYVLACLLKLARHWYSSTVLLMHCNHRCFDFVNVSGYITAAKTTKWQNGANYSCRLVTQRFTYSNTASQRSDEAVYCFWRRPCVCVCACVRAITEQLHRVSRNCANLFLSAFRHIFTNFDNFWPKDGKEAKTMWDVLIFDLI